MARRITLFLLLLTFAAVAAVAQEHPVVQTGFAADKIYNFHGIDSVNTFNGNLNITLPIGLKYPVNGGFSYGLTLSYNSKVWSYTEVTNLCGGATNCPLRVMRAEPSHRSNAGLGWLLSMGRMVPAENPSSTDPNGGYQTADGSVHAWYGSPHPDPDDPVDAPGVYTRDNTYFRATGISTAPTTGTEVHHPDGTVHSFNTEGELTSIADAFGNDVKIRTIENPVELSSIAACRLPADSNLSSAWEIIDSDFRVHYVCFTDKPRYPKNIYGNQLVKRVVLQSPGDQTAVYEFNYKIPVDAAGNKGVLRGCWSYMWNEDHYPDVPVLDSIQLPDGSFFRATYVLNGRNCAQGSIESLTLPTGGKLEYTYRFFSVPSGTCGDTGNWFSNSTGVHKRRLVDGVTNPTWTYTSEYEAAPGGMHDCGWIGESFILKLPNPHEVQATIVEAPDGTKEKTWYAVWPYGDASPNGYDPRDFSLPLKRHDTEDGTFLSTETYGRDGTKLRSSYVHFDYDRSHCLSWDNETWGGLLSDCYDANRRITKERTVYHDDGNRVAKTTYSDFDGFGHFRKTERTGTFGSDTTRTSYTNFNPGTDSKGRRNGAFAFDAGDLWILNTFDFKTESEGTQSMKTEACFDALGFLERTRTLKNYAAANGTFTRDKHDLLSVYKRNGFGNLTEEQYFGGDCLDASGGDCPQDLELDALCDLTPPSTAGYEIRHTYSRGVRESSRYFAGGSAMPFKSLDRTIDWSGAVTCDKDSAELATCYTYDKMGRIKTVAPAGGAVTSYDYRNATFSKPAEVVMSRGGSQTTYQFDPIGRLRRELRLMPDGLLAIQDTRYDEQGRKSYVSEWEKTENAATFSPTYGTHSTYDDFGRPLRVTAADTSATEFGYDGARIKTRTSRIWTGNDDEPVSATEEYDVFGRLVKVTEKSGNTTANDPIGDDIVTTYGYDVAGRLTSVVMGPKNGPAIQDRAFTYDGRGFLTLERHPESGQTSYGGYDPRGHARVRTSGGRTLKFAFDGAERLTDVGEDVGGTVKPLKHFEFGDDDDPASARGKLVTAVRHNDLVSAGDIDVTESYAYASPSGQMSNRTTHVERVNGASRSTIQKFAYGVTYDNLLLPRTITMPTCGETDCPTGEGLASVTNSRTAGYLTSVDGFAELTYHASGMVESVKHETPSEPVDSYGTRFNMPRPSKITFSGCGATKPYFLPGFVLAKVDPNACGIQITWPSATLCGGVSNVKYRIYRDNVDVTGPNCVTGNKFVDTGAVKGQTYTYKVVAEGPSVDGGTGICQQGQTVEKLGKPFEFKSCDAATILTLGDVRASLGVPARFSATLSSANGPLQEELLTFSVLGKVLGTARTAANGTAILDHAVDVDQAEYPAGIKVTYAGGLFPAAESTAKLTAVCDGFSFTVIPMALNVLPIGGNFPIIVATSKRCAWTPGKSPRAFFTIDPTTEQKGTGTFNINIPDAQGAGERSSHAIVSDKLISVKQGSGCNFRFEPFTGAYVPYKSNFSTQMSVFAPEGCEWSVTTDAGWLHLEKSSGTGDGFIQFRVSENSGVKRTAVLTLNGGEETVHVNQYGPPVVKCPVLAQDLTGPGTVEKGQFISLRAHVEGTYLEYEWWIDGRPTGKCNDDSRCASKNLAPGNDGYPAPGQSTTFQLVVSNSCDTVVTDEIRVTNLGAGSCRVPIITDGLFINFTPFDQGSAFPGNVVRLSVVGLDFGSQEPLKYQWYEGFAGDTDDKVSDALGGKTDEIAVRPHQTSFYWVEVTNACGTNVSRTAAVFMPDAPPRRRRRVVRKDFNLDGKTDLVWQNTATGQTEVEVMNGLVPSGTTIPLQNSGVGPQLQSIGDIDDNERPDVIFRDPATGKNTVWTMNGTHLTGVRPLDDREDGRWSIGGVADLDNDYNDDIIWHNNATGENEIWFQQGTEHEGTWTLPASPGPSWGLHGTEDFNRDDRPDLFFHDRATGQNVIWYMNDAEPGPQVGTNSTGSSLPAVRRLEATMQPIETMEDTNWLPAMVADMNNDGYPDIVWRNGVSGENKIWTMTGATVTGTVDLPSRDTNWQIGGGGSTNAGNPGGGTDPRTSTTLTVAADPAPLGTAAAVTATLKAGSNAVAQRQIAFVLNGTEVSRLLTDADGSATAALSVANLAAGTYPNAITVRFDGDTLYNNSSATANLVVLGQTPEVDWINPAPIVYGTPLSAVQLNATANVPGTFVYAPPAGTILDAGYQTLAVTFTPGDASIAPITRNAVLLVTKAASSVTWARPEAITYGVPLSDDQLNATSALTGTFEYEPEAGTVLPVGNGHQLRVTFTPESPNYESSTASTTIDVGKGSQVLRWTDPLPILFGEALGSVQLNATVIASGTEPAGALTYTPPAGTVLPEGVHELKVSVAETASYLGATATVDILVRSSTFDVIWKTPAPITYGTALSAVQLNATATVAGTFNYTPADGTVLDAGSQQLTVVFTPADPRYQPVTRSVSLQVLKVKTEVAWSIPVPIVYGTALSLEELDAAANSPGMFVYTPALGTILDAGSHELTAVFTPSDARNYEAASAKVTLIVLRAPQTITWSKPATIVYGTPLSATQLNATVSVVGPSPAGALSYTPPAGTILNAGAGQTLTVSAAATPNYEPATATVTIDVEKATQVLTWAQPAGIVYGTALSAAQLNATVQVVGPSAAGALTYTPPAGTILNAGARQTLTVSAAATPNYEPATASVTIDVDKATPVLAWAQPAAIVYGTPLSAAQLNATAQVAGPSPAGALTYTPPAGTILNAGARQTLTVSAAATPNYEPVTGSVTIDVEKATPVFVWVEPAAIVYGTPLSAAQLNATVQVVGPSPAGALTYTPPAGTILNAGAGQTLTVSVAATPNYEPATASVTIDVEKATPVLAWAQPAGIVYGTPLGAEQLNATADVPGTFAYDPPASAILDAGHDQTLRAHFTPADTQNYNHADADVTIDVAKARQTIAWPQPAPIVYGTALSATQLKASVTVVGPSPAGAVTYTPAGGTVLDVGLGRTLSVAVAETPNYEPASASVTIDVLRAPLSLKADPKSKLYGGAVPTLTGVLTGVVNNDPITATYATTATQQSPAGTYPITAALVDPNNRLVNYDVTITPSTLTVLPAPLLIAANPATKQYSDPLPTLTATYTGFVLGETPAVLSGTLLIQTPVEPRSAPGAYPITIGGLTSPNYAITYAGSTFTVTEEDARMSIISPRLVSAVTSGPTTILLSASVQDISATADAAGDVHPGDIRKAVVTFVDRATGSALCTAPIGLTVASDERTGVVTCTFSRDFGTTLPASLVVGAKVTGYYTRDTAADDATLTIDKATADHIAGAGSITVATAAGRSAPDLGSSAKLQLQMQYHNSGELRGHFNFTFERTEGGAVRKFELALNAQSSMAIARSTAGGTATILGTASIRDVTGGVVVVQAAPVVITATDAGEPGTSDGISVTVFDPQGGVWLATGWNGLQAVELKLNNGNLNVVQAKGGK
jgi:YD repeat-containing protein